MLQGRLEPIAALRGRFSFQTRVLEKHEWLFLLLPKTYKLYVSILCLLEPRTQQGLQDEFFKTCLLVVLFSSRYLCQVLDWLKPLLLNIPQVFHPVNPFSVELGTKSYYVVNRNIRGGFVMGINVFLLLKPIVFPWMNSFPQQLIHSPPVIIPECLFVCLFAPSLLTYLCRFSTVSKCGPAVGAPEGGSSALFPSDLPGEWQRPRHSLQGVSERHLCGGQDPPTCGQVCNLQWSYGRLRKQTSRVLCQANGSSSQTHPPCVSHQAVVSMACVCVLLFPKKDGSLGQRWVDLWVTMCFDKGTGAEADKWRVVILKMIIRVKNKTSMLSSTVLRFCWNH